MASLPPDPYRVLGVTSDASLSEIRYAYRKLVLTCHPDLFKDPDVKAVQGQEFQRVQEAYELLSDSSLKAKYDVERGMALSNREKRHTSSQKRWQKGVHQVETESDDVSESTSDSTDSSDGESRSSHGTRRRVPVRQSPSRIISSRRERQEFIAYALEILDEAKKQKMTISDHNTATVKSDVSVAHSSIEEQIKMRNNKFQKSKASPARSPKLSLSSSPSEKANRATATKKFQAVPVEQLNLEVMNPSDHNDRVDIVAVHGLGAIPDITWKEKTSSINWLSHEDMLPKAVPEARILRFGYDSLWMGETPIRTSLSTIAYKLLLSLNMMRVEDLERPLIFIGHCFGGLVIERALNLAKMRQEKYPGLFDSSVGVVFLGTPHRGSQSFTRESALLAAIAASSDLSKHLETSVLDTMTSDTGSLLDVSDDFITLCMDGGPKISCFFEQRSSKLGKVVGRTDITEFIVDSASATFDGHPKHGLEVDHFSLNKFNSPSNPHYLQVRAEIVRFYKAALKKADLVSQVNDIDSAAAGSSTPSRAPPEQSFDFKSHRSEAISQKSRSQPFRPNQILRKVPEAASSKVSLEDEVLRREAVKELREEESRKKAVIQEEHYQNRVAKEKRAIELAFLQRLKKNMSKYGIENPGAILEENPLPKDEELTGQEIKEKNSWYLNYLKGALADTGVDGGQIDEILNDNGETMMIDGVETTITRMARKWVSTRTLNAYEIPWQYDEVCSFALLLNSKDDDSSTIIVKRWVPDYEQAFLWDHSMALRGDRGRKQHRYQDPPKTNKPSEKLLQQMSAIFKSGQRKMLWEDQSGRRTENFDTKSRYVSARERRDSYTMPKTGRYSSTASTPPDTDRRFRRSQSNESVHSAPDSEEVARRRKHSRTLSGDRPKGRTGAKFHRDSSGEKRSSSRYSDPAWRIKNP
ncbi:unnamed protein product [Clonostachys rosea]|uniref:J domain-containing protein n=1 Tax=Bionectria ochroleuca TaxID=29856 RepID=A0ABY6UKI8_BIOOC|nr:unnamed protein product [Clonostachys rosea]